MRLTLQRAQLAYMNDVVSNKAIRPWACNWLTRHSRQSLEECTDHELALFVDEMTAELRRLRKASLGV